MGVGEAEGFGEGDAEGFGDDFVDFWGDGLADDDFFVDELDGDGLAEEALAELEAEGLAEPDAEGLAELDGDALGVASGFTVVAEGTCKNAIALAETSPIVEPEGSG